MNIQKKQNEIIDSIKKELSNDNIFKPSSFKHSVWFQPECAKFLYNDEYIEYEVIEPLIENKTLRFKKIENHQGEQMIRYVLS
jgi:hypothetical protein